MYIDLSVYNEIEHEHVKSCYHITFLNSVSLSTCSFQLWLQIDYVNSPHEKLPEKANLCCNLNLGHIFKKMALY